jgi:hypothetical protein
MRLLRHFILPKTLHWTIPLFIKEGLGEIFQIVSKIPRYPPLYPRGHKIKGDMKENNP